MSKGYRYNELGEYPTTATIAAAIRAEIKIAKAEGLLPSTWKYSVRSQNYSGGRSIDVTVTGPNEEVWVEEDLTKCPLDGRTMTPACSANWHFSPRCEGAKHLSEIAKSAEITLERIHGSFNHNNSDIQSDYFDVRYYGQVTFAGAW
jgi:hypothetical protein